MRKVIYSVISPPVIFFAGFFTFIIAIFVILFSAVRFNKTVVFILNVWAKSVFLLIGKRLHVKGIEKVQRDKNYILVANHGSMFDIMGIMAICPNVSWLGKDYLTKIPIFKNALHAINYIPMKTTDLQNTKFMLNKMIENSGAQTIAIFPEGKRTINGNFNKFRKGFVHVFRATELDILPVTLNGFYDFKPKTRSYINFKSKLEIVINDVIKSEQLLDLDNQEIVKTVDIALSTSYIK